MDGRSLIRHLPAGQPKPGSTAERLFKQHQRVQADTNRRLAHRAELQKSAELTEVGKQRQSLDFSLGVMGQNVQGRRDLERFESEIAAKRAKIVMPKGDPSDAVGAIRRMRMRDRMLAMPAEDRHKHLMKNRDDPQLLITLLEASEDGEDVGVSETLLSSIVQDVKKKLNGPLLEELEFDEKLADAARSALDTEFADIHKEAVSVDPSFADQDRFMARALEAAKLTDRPWLKEFQENGATVVRELAWNESTNSGSWRIPSEDALANGIVAKTRDEFDRLKTAPPLDRKDRAAYVNTNGVQAYLDRNKQSA